MIYLDSSALLKLVLEEPESAELEAWLTASAGTPVVSSELARVEVIRACRRANADALPAARTLLAGLDLIPLTTPLVEDAADVGEPLLRGLDAIHLASALSIDADLSVFVAYDQRLADAASAADLETFRPGESDDTAHPVIDAKSTTAPGGCQSDSPNSPPPDAPR